MNSAVSFSTDGPTFPWISESSPDSMTEALSRYHFMGVTQTRSVYSEYPVNLATPIRIEKIIRTTVPTNPESTLFLRQIKLYFYIVDNNGVLVPLQGPIQILNRTSAGWNPISVSNVEWIFIDNADPNERYYRLIFAPLRVTPFEVSSGTNTYEIQIQFEPTLPPFRVNYKIFTKGSDRMGDVYNPAMSVYFTTCPNQPEDCRNLLLEVVSSLINMADQAGVYNDTEYSGAASRVIAALPHLRSNGNEVVNDLKRHIQTLSDRLKSVSFSQWVNSTPQ